MVVDGANVRFEELFSEETLKMEVIVTFIAILELVKRGRLEFLQTEVKGPIWLQQPSQIYNITSDDDSSEEETET